MNLETDTWDIINSYFRDNPNYLVRHHIDSYNDFIQNKIPLIFQNLSKEPPFILIDNDNITTYEIKVYYGGKSSNKYMFTKPTIKTFPSGEVRQLFPNEARLKDITYGSDFFYSVDIEITIKKNGIILDDYDHVLISNSSNSPNSSYLDNIYLGNIPIMLKSDLCVLKSHSDEILSQMGEDPYDVGGYFILDGSEKTIVSQERKAENIIFLNIVPQNTGSEKYTHIAEIKCISDEAFANAKTVKVQLEKKGPITVRLGQATPFLETNQNRDVPLFIMFRALGVETDKQIIEYIVGNIDQIDQIDQKDNHNKLLNEMLDLLRPSILDPFILDEEIYSKESAEAYLVKLPRRAKQNKEDRTSRTGGTSGPGGHGASDNMEKEFSKIDRNKTVQLSYLYGAFTEALFPHITTVGNLNKAKAYYLGYVTRKLLLLRLGIESETDRDNFANKRIDLSGFLISTLFRDAFKQVNYNARIEVNRAYTFNSAEYSGENIMRIINETNFTKIFSSDSFKKKFNGQLKIGTIGEKKGVVQSLDRLTRNLTIAHLRRIIDNVGGDKSKVSISRRRLHATQYGCVCPSDTPEGEKVGLNKGLAIISHITFGCQTKPMIDFCLQKGVELLDDFLPTEIGKLCKILINGNWFGCHRNPESFVNIFKLYRRNGLVNIFNSISWERTNNEIKIYTDGGRFIRPLYIIENNNILIQPKHIKQIQENNITFKELVSGFSKRNEDYDYYDDSIKDISYIGINNNDPLYIDKLRDAQSIIEYVDSEEFNTTLLSIGFNIAHNSLQKYTHVELHPSMILSFNVHMLPFMNYTAGSRVTFSSKHIKQGISTYAMNFNNRIDTSSLILNYPEKPLATCRLNKILGSEKFGQGHNLFIAVAKYNYNQDDAIIGNQYALDMGLFGTSYYKMYSDHEMLDVDTGEEHHFYNPLHKDEMEQYPQDEDLKTKKGVNFNKLDKYGLPKKGAYIEEKDIVIGKYMKSKNDKGETIFKDMSTKVKLGNEGSMVDRVYTCQTNSNGDRMTKVRTCQFRPPVMGDKFASRNGQKGIFGLVMKKEDLPYTEDGISPDIIFDPAGFPKRMTASQFMEMLFGNMAAELGFQGTFTPFETVNMEQINDILETKLGLTSMGERILYNGMTGTQMEVTIFCGVIYYQRLKYMVDDKINTRLTGERENGIPVPGGLYTVNRQSVSGRANEGGLRIGEMERDALLSHGIWSFIKESYIERCDKFIIQVSKTSGEITISNPDKHLYYDNITDGITSYQLDDNIGHGNLTNEKIIGVNMYGQKSTDFINLVVPYTFKILIQEMQGMCMSVKLNVDKLKQIIKRDNDTDLESDNLIEITESDIDKMIYDDDDGDGDDGNSNVDGDDGNSNVDGNSDGDGGNSNVDGNSDGDGDVDGNSDGDGDGDGNSNSMGGGNLEDQEDQEDQSETESVNDNDNDNSDELSEQINVEDLEEYNYKGGDNSNSFNQNFQRANLNPDINININKNNLSGGNSNSLNNFDIIEDDNSIEEINNQLLGIQNAGYKSDLDNAKTQGIENVLSTNTNTNIHKNGLNMSFNNSQNSQNSQIGGVQFQQNGQNSQISQNSQNGQNGQMGGNQNSQNGQNGQNSQMGGHQNSQNSQNGQMVGNQNGQNSQIGGNQNSQIGRLQSQPQSGGIYDTSKQLNFDSNIKVVEIDTSKNDGFVYGNSQNLDPFKN